MQNTNKVVLITGCANGIGFYLTRVLEKKGLKKQAEF
jgi:NADP-dependent 3-hydroxy acid dehydrogenase YdfG